MVIPGTLVILAKRAWIQEFDAERHKNSTD